MQQALPQLPVHWVHARGVHLNQNAVRAHSRDGQVIGDFQYLNAAVLFGNYSFHGR
jgi:hypothetical protein